MGLEWSQLLLGGSMLIGPHFRPWNTLPCIPSEGTVLSSYALPHSPWTLVLSTNTPDKLSHTGGAFSSCTVHCEYLEAKREGGGGRGEERFKIWNETCRSFCNLMNMEEITAVTNHALKEFLLAWRWDMQTVEQTMHPDAQYTAISILQLHVVLCKSVFHWLRL